MNERMRAKNATQVAKSLAWRVDDDNETENELLLDLFFNKMNT